MALLILLSGVKTNPTFLQNVMNNMIAGLLGTVEYSDDVIIGSQIED